MKYQLLLCFCFILILITDNKHFLVETEGDDETISDGEEEYVSGDYKIAPQTYSKKGSACIRCGVERSIEERSGDYVIGGQEAEKYRYPWMVSLHGKRIGGFGRWATWTCGGTLIASRYVLTAAHCVVKSFHPWVPASADEIKVYIGRHYNSIQKGVHTASPPVSKIIVHNGFNFANVKKKMGKAYDLALLELSEDVDLKTFPPACLARSSDLTTFDNKMALATGWGLTEKGKQSFALLEVKLKVTPLKQNNGSNIRTHNFEFGANHGVASGDSGGPLTYLNENGQYSLIGVSESIGSYNETKSTSYSVFMRVSHYRDWIEKNMKSPKYCQNGLSAGTKN